MIVIPWIFLVIILGSGIALVIFTYRRSKTIFWGKERSLLRVVGNSVLSGTSASLIFTATALLIGIMASNHIWTPREIITILVLGLIVGVIATLGSFWQFYLVGRFRNYLVPKIKGNKKD